MSVFSHIKNDKLSSLSLFAIGLVCIFLSYIFLNFNIFISPLIVAILFGILLTNLFSNRVKFLKSSAVLLVATKQILRLGIIFMGFVLALQMLNM
nr:putative sulfate exporter family transporter [Campylobacter majalis]